MRNNIIILMNYSTISKKNLGIYFLFLWLVLTFITLPDINNIMEDILPSFVIFVTLGILFVLRILIDFTRMKKLKPNINSTIQINEAVNYLEKLKIHAMKTSMKHTNNSNYIEFIEAYNALSIYYGSLLEGVDNDEY